MACAILLTWFLIAVLFGAAGAMQTLRPPGPQLMIVGLTAAALAAIAFVPVLRRWALTVDVRTYVAFHLTRFVGLYFLYLYQRSRLPYEFAVPGGVGDVVVALAAAALLALPRAARHRGVLFAWNLAGLIDIVFVVATATRLGMASPESMAELLRLPLALLPTFVVPLILVTHTLIFVRLLVSDQGAATAGNRARSRLRVRLCTLPRRRRGPRRPAPWR